MASIEEVKNRITCLLLYCDTLIGEIDLGMSALIYGAWLASPFWVAMNPSLSSYGVFLKLAPETVWGAAFVVLGIFQLSIAIFSKKYYSRRLIATVSLFMWTLIVILYGIGNPSSPGIALALPNVIISIIVAIHYTGGKQ